MTELAKCRCGAEAEWQISTDGKVGRWCRRCGIHGPWCPFEELMDAAWNSLMRPRPTATKGSRRVYLGSPSIRIGFVGDDGDDDWIARCIIDGWHVHCYSEDDAMAELVEHLRGLGFDVEIANG